MKKIFIRPQKWWIVFLSACGDFCQIPLSQLVVLHAFPDSKVHGANMGPTWVLSAPGGPHVSPMNLAIWVRLSRCEICWALICKYMYVWHHHLKRSNMIWFWNQETRESQQSVQNPIVSASKEDLLHYCDAIMGTVASQITSLTNVYTTVYSDAYQSKHQSSASLAFVWGIHRGPRWIPNTNGQ